MIIRSRIGGLVVLLFLLLPPAVRSQSFGQNASSQLGDAHLPVREKWHSFSQALADGDPTRAWSILSTADLQVDGPSGSPVAFEFIDLTHHEQGSIESYHRVLAGANGGNGFIVYLDDTQLPSFAGISERTFSLSKNGAWKSHQSAWKLIFAATGPGSAFTMAAEENRSQVALRTPTYLADIREGTQIHWIPAEMALEATDDKGTLRIVMNTPADQLTHEYPLALLRSSKPGGRSFQFRAITRSPLYVPHLQFQEDDLPSGLRIIPSAKPDPSISPLTTSSRVESATKFWSHVSPYKIIEKSKLSGDPQVLSTLSVRERLHMIIGLLLEDRELTQLKAASLHSLAITHEVLQAAIAEDTSSSLPDSPSLRWRHMETQLGELDAMMFSRGLSYVATSPKAPFDVAAVLTRLQIMLGESPLHSPQAWRYPSDREGLDEDRLRQFHAFRNACWGYGADEEVADSCKKIFQVHSAKSEPSYLAVDVMLRLGKAAEIPKDVLDAWFAASVLRAHPGFRAHYLAALTMTPGGRAYLLEWVQDSHVRLELWKACVEHLQSRVDATLATGRFDFMSREECERIQLTLGSLEL